MIMKAKEILMSKRIHNIFYSSLLIACLFLAPPAGALTYHVEIMDLDAGQPMTPPVVTVHEDGYHLFELGSQASMGLQQLAEDGMTMALLEEANMSGHVHHAMVGGSAPTFASFKFLIQAEPGDLFSFASMFAKTNDVFVGVSAVPLPESPLEMDAMAYDAGTEVNTGMMAHIPAYGNVGVGEDEDNPIAEINSYAVVDDPDQGMIEYSWPPAAKVMITPMPDAVEYKVTMNGLSDGQPLTPPLIAIHDESVSVYEMGEQASTGLEMLAEEGATDTLKMELLSMDGVWNVYIGGDAPGFEQMTTLIAEPGQRISIVSMFARTNDVFTGVAGAMLPQAGAPLAIETNAYDAGTEMNTGMMAHIPAYGNAGGPDEDGTVMEINSYTVVDDPDGQLDYTWPPAAMIEIEGMGMQSHVSHWDLY
ncbi:hypothetical protein GF373_13770 [bacterium]|nr:hypothetical protein [bacterium]